MYHQIIDTFPDLKYLFIDLDGCFIPFKIDNVRSFSKNVLIVKLKEISSEDKVMKLLIRIFMLILLKWNPL